VPVHSGGQQPRSTGETHGRQQPPSNSQRKRQRVMSTTGAKDYRTTTTGGYSAAQQPGLAADKSQAASDPRQPGSLVCNSIIDRQAARALQTLLEADAGQRRGATLKSLTLAPHIAEKKATYAVTCQVLKRECCTSLAAWQCARPIQPKTRHALCFAHLQTWRYFTGWCIGRG
jgi:hypothetical protein